MFQNKILRNRMQSENFSTGAPKAVKLIFAFSTQLTELELFVVFNVSFDTEIE